MTWPASIVMLNCLLNTVKVDLSTLMRPNVLVQHVAAAQLTANAVFAITGALVRSLNGFACLQVKEAMTHSWAAYEQFAWGFDELQPLTQEGKDSLGGLGATIIDSLDTLWMFDMQDEFVR